MSYKTILKTVLRQAGYAVYRVPRGESERAQGYAYAAAHPNATLAPWLADAEFMAAFEIAKNNSLVDVYRMHELWSLVAETAKIGGDIVEVGVWRGGTGAVMARKEKLLGGSGRVFLCDTFRGVVKAGAEDSDYRGGEHDDTNRAIVEDLLGKIDAGAARILEGVFPDETGRALDSDRVRLLHVDVDVYQSAKDSVEFLWDRMPAGAAIAFDDYGFVGCEGVTRYADELRARKDVFFLHNLNGHAVIVKK
jgi:O-methyltransferase